MVTLPRVGGRATTAGQVGNLSVWRQRHSRASRTAAERRTAPRRVEWAVGRARAVSVVRLLARCRAGRPPPRPTPRAKAHERRSCRFGLATSWSSPPRSSSSSPRRLTPSPLPSKAPCPGGPRFLRPVDNPAPRISLSGCSGSCTRWGYLDSGPTCRPVRVFPGGRAREYFPSLLDARSTARTLPLRDHRCRSPEQHPCHRILPCFLVLRARGEGAARHRDRPSPPLRHPFSTGEKTHLAELTQTWRPPPCPTDQHCQKPSDLH